MNDLLISRIQAFTLNARKSLERETEEQLQGLYGWLPDGSFGKGTALALPEAAETRKRLEAYVAEEGEAKVDAAAARAKLKRETAFTWLNRAVAFRLLEERGIIKPTLAKLLKANAFIYWLTEVKDEANIPASTPVNALGEGPVDAAYREFLLWQCGQLAIEVSVLFDPATLATLASRCCPRPAVLKELVEAMNAADLVDAWKTGNEETVGWVYEGFIEDENAEVFEKFSKGKKVLAEEIGAATQRFTPRWIVQFLVQNSIGRIWAEMHPDSGFANSLDYLVPLKSASERQLKPVRDITFLDPCCGSMHFGLLAFDLFVEMYREERKNAGKPGWPKTPSAATEEEIPQLILAHNLHGIDIDLRAIQVSALALLIKARTLNPKAAVTDANLATANIEQLTGGRLDDFISATPFSHPIYERILRRLASRLKDSNHLGSLLRIEGEIEQLIAAERKQSAELFEKLPGFDAEQFETQAGIEEFFGILTDQIGQHLDHFVRASGGGLFAAEAAKGLRFLRLVERRYDVVATNPPYLSLRNMSGVMTAYLGDAFKSSKGDLYAGFIMRCVELTDPLGLVAMVTQQSFMFISSYEEMRAELRKTVGIESMAHLGPRAFPNITGEKVNTTAFVLRREPEAANRERQIGTYFRLVKERDADAKRLAFEASLAALRQGGRHSQLFHYQQSDFDAIPTKPWVYWVSPTVRELFHRFPALNKQSAAVTGINTGDNLRFRRYWWEISDYGNRWHPFVSGGPYRKWYGNLLYLVTADIAQMELLHGSALRSRNYWLKEGLTFCLISTSGFNARYLPPGYLFSSGGNCWFSESLPHQEVLGYLNSTLASYLLLLLNPTINYTVGSIGSLPWAGVALSELKIPVENKVERVRQFESSSEISPVFRQPLNGMEVSSFKEEALWDQQEIDNIVYEAYGLDPSEAARIENDLKSISLEDASSEESAEEVTETSTGDVNRGDWARSWVSYALGTVLGRYEIGTPGRQGCGDFSEATAAEIRQLIDMDGIMPCDVGHPQDIAARAFACLELMLCPQPAREAIHTATDTEGDPIEALRGWLDRFTGTPDKSFWKYHHQLYRKRPVYWPFQSPNKHFTVWVFHEKLGPNTLHTIKDLAQERLNLLERSRIPAIKAEAATSRAKERDLDRLLDESDDLLEFIQRLQAHIDTGYQSCLDDGVLLNAAPLHDLLPSWPDTTNAWKDLENKKFEWAHQAMRHWPDRVTDACRTNRSFAIAHGLEHLCPAAPPKAAGKRGRQTKVENLI